MNPRTKKQTCTTESEYRIPSLLRAATYFSVGIGEGRVLVEGITIELFFCIPCSLLYTLASFVFEGLSNMKQDQFSSSALLPLIAYSSKQARCPADKTCQVPKENLKRSGCVLVQRPRVCTLFHSDHQNPLQPDPSEDEGHRTDLV